MNDSRKTSLSSPAPNGMFPGTRWSLVIHAADHAGPELEELCRIYWQPLYSFLRHSGHSADDAEDLTQSFFHHLLTAGGLQRAAKAGGRLRSFLLGALKRHRQAQRAFAGRQKRGGDVEHLPLATSELDFADAEHQFASHPVDHLTPDRVYDQRWVLELLGRTHQCLRADYEAAGKIQEYEILKIAVATTGEIDSNQAAATLRISPGTVRVLIHRLRKNFRAAFRDEIAETVACRSEIDEELRELLNAFS